METNSLLSNSLLSNSPWAATNFDNVLQQLNLTSALEKRRRAFAKFAELGWPRTSLEEWKYTQFGSINDLPQHQLPASTISKEGVANWGDLGERCGRIVFNNGSFSPALSEIPSSCRVEIVELNDDGFKSFAQATESWGESHSHSRSALSHLNKALAQQAILVEVLPNTTLTAPLEIVWAINASQAGVIFPQLVVQVGQSSSATIIERFIGTGHALNYTCGSAYLDISSNAVVNYLKIQEEAPSSHHWHELYVNQASNSRCRTFTFSFGGAVVRNEIFSALRGTGSQLEMFGLSLGDGNRHIDNATEIEHAMPHCDSREIYKGVYADSSSGAFSGTIIVQPHAQKTNAIQSNKGLLLSQDAEFNTRPQLKIWADDVKCTHGAAVGQLDDNALFYLRSRGISRQEAMSLLTQAFCHEVINELSNHAISNYVNEKVNSSLAATWSKL